MGNLQYLELEENKILDISILEELKNLTSLYLQGNQISNISALKNLRNLETLFINGNKIKELPDWICDFPKMQIEWAEDSDLIFNVIHLYGNPIENVPKETIQQGNEAIKNYFEEKIIRDFQALNKV